MELHYYVHQGFAPVIFDKQPNLRRDESIMTAGLCLTEGRSREVVPATTIVGLVASLLHKLSNNQPITFIFPTDVGKIQRQLKRLDIPKFIQRGQLTTETTLSNLPSLANILEAAAFTTFLGRVRREGEDGQSAVKKPQDRTFPISGLDYDRLSAVFALYDESMELVSKQLSAGKFINTVMAIARDAGMQTHNISVK